MVTLAELETRVAAREAQHADYRAVLAAVNATGLKVAGHEADSRRQFDVVGESLRGLTASVDDARTGLGERIRSLEEGQSEIKDLLVRALGR